MIVIASIVLLYGLIEVSKSLDLIAKAIRDQNHDRKTPPTT